MRNSLEKHEGIVEIEIEWNIRQVEVTYDPTHLDAERIVSVVSELYPARVKRDRPLSGAALSWRGSWRRRGKRVGKEEDEEGSAAWLPRLCAASV